MEGLLQEKSKLADAVEQRESMSLGTNLAPLPIDGHLMLKRVTMEMSDFAHSYALMTTTSACQR